LGYANVTMPTDLALILIGLGVGLLVGLTGVGGGSLMTPLLVLAMGVPSTIAVGTDLVYSAVTRSVGAIVHIRQGTVRLQAACWLASGSVPAALITTALVGIALHHARHFMQGFITHALAAVLIFVAASLLCKPLLARLGDVRLSYQRPIAISIGVLIGALVSLTSVGGGALTMVALLLLYRAVSTTELIGTDVFHAAILSLVAATAHIFIVDFHIAALLLVGSLPGVVLGSRLAVQIPDVYLRFALAGTLAFVGVRLM
jgi:uncharacterized membrane protein YfcA